MTHDFDKDLSQYWSYFCYCGIGRCFFKMPEFQKRIDYIVRDIIRVQNMIYINGITNGQNNAYTKGANKDWGSNGLFFEDGSICPKYILEEGSNKTFDYDIIDKYYDYMKRQTTDYPKVDWN